MHAKNKKHVRLKKKRIRVVTCASKDSQTCTRFSGKVCHEPKDS